MRRSQTSRHSDPFGTGDALGSVLNEIWALQQPDTQRLLVLCDEAVARAAATTDARARTWAHLTRALFASRGLGTSSAEADLQVAKVLVEQANDARAARLIDVCEATLQMRSGNHVQAAGMFKRLPLQGRVGKDDTDDYFILLGLGTCAASTGDIQGAFDALHANLHLCERTNAITRKTILTTELASLLFSIGCVPEGIQLLQEHVADMPLRASDRHLRAQVKQMLGAGYLLAGRAELASSNLLDVIEDVDLVSVDPELAFQAHERLATAYMQLGLSEAADRHLDVASRLAHTLAQPHLTGRCLLVGARMARDEGRLSVAIESLEAALACFERPGKSKYPLSHELAAQLLTECYAQSGHYERAYACHRRFFEFYQQRAEYVARGRAIGLRTPSGSEPIPMSEREIDCLRWCAAGKTAWETGQILKLSEWTVVYHLEKAKRKFGLTRKHQAVAKAISLGLISTESFATA